MISTFGVSSKEGDNPIGFFGTGLKYAIAILIREGCKVTLNVGGKDYKFKSKKKKIRVNEFDFIMMNRKQLPFTTELGKTWELWQAMRELYCNCLDENGWVIEDSSEEIGKNEHSTYITVEGDKFLNVWAEKDSVFLNTKPVYSDGKIEIHKKQSSYLFYRGMRALKLEKPSLFTYNIIETCLLTEDRTFKNTNTPRYKLEKSIANISELIQLEAIHKILIADDCFFEKQFNYSCEVLYSNTFKSSVDIAAKHHPSKINKTALIACKKSAKELAKDLCGVKISDEDQSIINDGALICKKIGFDVFEYNINVAEFLGDGIMGLACDNEIFITRLALIDGVDVVASTLLEEYIHLKYRLQDETRALETFLFNLSINLAKKL